MSNVSALVSLRQRTALCQIRVLASAATALCQLWQSWVSCRLREPPALSLPLQSRWLCRFSKVPARPQLRQRRFRALAPAGQNARKIQCQVCSVISQEQYTRSWCALRRWCQVAFKNALSGVPSSALTLPSSGQSKGCALRLPLISNVRRRIHKSGDVRFFALE